MLLVVSIAISPVASMSNADVVIASSVSATKSNWPSVLEFIYVPESLNCNCISSFNNNPVSETWVSVTSLSAPNDRVVPSSINLNKPFTYKLLDDNQ